MKTGRNLSMKKKVLSILLSAVMAGTMLVGCGNGESKGSEEKKETGKERWK